MRFTVVHLLHPLVSRHRVQAFRSADQSACLFLDTVFILAIQVFRRRELCIFLVPAYGFSDRGYQPGKRFERSFLVCTDRLNQTGDFARFFPAAPVNPDYVAFHRAS
ncbi:MAG: hypothetical protein PVJ15_04400 [Gammaproteobacteria bacterium]